MIKAHNSTTPDIRKEIQIMARKVDENYNKSQFYCVDDVVDILGVSRPKAYAIMRELNMELKNLGYIIVSGKVSARYFNEKMYIQTS